MSRYFIEVAYKGTDYSGFQVQENANTIQAEIQKAFKTIHRNSVELTGSSRTDAGVHALQNFFHFDYEEIIHPQFVYKLNALLPKDIAVKNLFQMSEPTHSRFDAISREYTYNIHRFKDPFIQATSLYFPYRLDMELINQASDLLKQQTNFFAFSKTNTQVKNFNCRIIKSEWIIGENTLTYNIEANRFLRGMVRAITATLLKIGRHKMTMFDFEKLFNEKRKAGYSVPAHGLFLTKVSYPENYFPASGLPFTGF
ncbi:MAG TPA: tRNA pseudouridine(38-40) synthase TruA [Flavisolibacter sp.]|jgi:tRNA pseudouridine38-40 synthase|nr:tRNA pseudouridine(38-40) synthase TruA [Flavisolibacter sp.]